MQKNNSLSKNFLGEEREYDYCRVAVLPVPYDGTATYQKGTSEGPSAIIEASCHLEIYDIDVDENINDIGIATLDPVKPGESAEKTAENVYSAVKKILDGNRFPVVIGGEHSITAGAVRAIHGKFDKLSVLQLDAHADLREEYEGDKFSHACVMKRVLDMGLPIVQAGIRSLSDEEADLIKKKKLPVFWAKDIHSDNSWFGDAVSRLKENVYVTIDIDVFDASVAPSTGTPEPGGLEWYNIIDFLKEVAKKKNIVGFDIVEVIPHDRKVTEFSAAKLIYTLLGYVFFSKKLERK